MMKWLTIVSLLVRLALQIFSYLERQQTLKEGEEKALRELEGLADELVNRARIARSSINNADADIMSDPYNDASRKRISAPDDPGSGV